MTVKRMRGPPLIRTPVVLPPDKHEHGEDECPVCYVSTSSSGPRAAVTCKVCKHAVCGECDVMMTHAGHERCPMCRAPRSSRLPLHRLLHAFNCADAGCQSPQCADAKLVLLRIEVHAGHCTNLELGGPDECKLCKLWRMLHSSRPPSALHAAAFFPAEIRGPPLPQETAGAVSERPDPVAVRAWLRGLPPVQVKSMLLSHVRQCRNQRCEPCRGLRERIRIRAAALEARVIRAGI